MFTFDLTAIVVWYWILAFIVMLLTLLAGIIHKAWIPVIWGLTISIIMVMFSFYLEPALFGWMITTDWLIQSLSFVFMIMWGILLFQGVYNSIRYGKVVK